VIYFGFLRALRRGTATTPLPFRADPQLGIPPGVPSARDSAPAALQVSTAIRHVDAGSCNGCESELTQLLSAAYDPSRLGITFTPSPRHADLLLVTGVVTQAMVGPLRTAYESLPEPRRVLAVGDCALGKCPLANMPGAVGPLDRLLPVDAGVPGCPPPPAQILRGILQAQGRLIPVQERERH
jgi:Ni,Fe-hydrogenase III small subunit